MTLLSYGLTSLYESIGDWVVYRNLTPADPRLPALHDLRPRLNLGDAVVPRKAEPAYGHVLAEVLRSARKLDLPRTAIQRLVYIGDTWMNDGNAFRNLCASGNWSGWAFMGRDELEQPPQIEVEGSLFQANRWAALPGFLRFLGDKGFALDEQTAAVIDVDKTFIGARGRNDKVIDAARVEAVQRTVANLLGPSFDQEAFQGAYNELKQAAYHPFTADNQDYLAYVCLMLGAGLFQLDWLIAEVRSGRMQRFADFIASVESRRAELAHTGLASVHDDVWRCCQAGDPTPFKAFRYNEYLTTASRFGDLPEATVEQILTQRIVITQEVQETATVLKQSGVLVLGVSDKPDEASWPNEAQAQLGMKPLHRMTTLAVGQTPQ